MFPSIFPALNHQIKNVRKEFQVVLRTCCWKSLAARAIRYTCSFSSDESERTRFGRWWCWTGCRSWRRHFSSLASVKVRLVAIQRLLVRRGGGGGGGGGGVYRGGGRKGDFKAHWRPRNIGLLDITNFNSHMFSVFMASSCILHQTRESFFVQHVYVNMYTCSCNSFQKNICSRNYFL